MLYSRLRQIGLVALAMFLALPAMASAPKQTLQAEAQVDTSKIIWPCETSYCSGGGIAVPFSK